LPTFSSIYNSIKFPDSLSLFSATIAYPEVSFSTLSAFKRWKATTFRIANFPALKKKEIKELMQLLEKF